MHRTLRVLHLVSLESLLRNHTRFVSAAMTYDECCHVCSEKRFTAHFKVIVASVCREFSRSEGVRKGNSSQSCGGENVFSFHLNFLWVAPVEPTQCDGLPEPEVSNRSRSTTTCFDYQNKLKPFKSSCPDGMRLASHDPVCDPILRKWVVRQRCYTVKCFNFLHIRGGSFCCRLVLT